MALEQTPLLAGQKMSGIPPAPFTKARQLANGRGQLPQAIAHRGYKAEYPENTLAGFRAAVAIGAHALETDLHLTRDGVVVLSHDPTLKRCFGRDEKIADCDWEFISTLKTTKEPSQPMPRLSDLLEFLAEPGVEKIWLLLDIKLEDDAETLLTRTAETISSVAPGAGSDWKSRIVLGCWNAHYVQLCKRIFPDFPIAYIGFSLYFAHKLLAEPNVHFNMFQKALVGPFGARFIAAARRAGRNLFLWTVNEEEWMEWSIRKQVDGVISDDPRLFLDVCRRWEEERGGAGKADNGGGAGAAEGVGAGASLPPVKRQPRSWRRRAGQWMEVLVFQGMIMVFMTLRFYKKLTARGKETLQLPG